MATILLNWLWLSTLVLSALWLFYYLALRHERSFSYNRALLVLAPLLAAALPLLPLTSLGLPAAPAAMQAPLHLVLPEVRVAKIGSTVPAASWLLLGYGVGIALLLGRLGVQLWQLRRFACTLPTEPRAGYTLRRTNGQRPTSSFGRTIFWDDSLPLTSAEAAQVLAHELAHVRQHHTFDRLWLRVWQAVLWPNPFVHLLPRALHLTHEYLADAAVASVVPSGYIRLLARQATNWLGQAPTLTHTFFSSSTLTRIAMLHQNNAPRRWKQWLALPLGCTLLGVVACEKTAQTEEAVTPQAQTVDQSSMPVPPPPPPILRNETGELIYFYVDQMPEPQNGMTGLLRYVGTTIQYPASAKVARLEGKVFINFVVDKVGNVTNAHVQKGIVSLEHAAAAQAMNEEALRVVQAAPSWEPGKQDGQPVNVSFTIPVTYALK